MVMEAEKAHNLLPASCRIRKAGGVIQSKSDALCQGADGISPGLGPKAQEPGTLMCTVQGQEKKDVPLKQGVNSPSLHLFVLFRPSMDWMMPTRTGEEPLLYSAHQVKC